MLGLTLISKHWTATDILLRFWLLLLIQVGPTQILGMLKIWYFLPSSSKNYIFLNWNMFLFACISTSYYWIHLNANTFGHLLMTDAFSQEMMSSTGIQISSDISTLSHNALQMVGWQWWPGTAHHLLASSSTPACSRASKRLFPVPPCKQLSSSPFLLFPEPWAYSTQTAPGNPCIPPFSQAQN